MCYVDWKRTLLSDGPRQAINACTLYSFAYANNFQTHDLPAYWDNSVSTLLLLLAMIATVLLFACSLLLMIAATLCYFPRKAHSSCFAMRRLLIFLAIVVCYIQGNLKEFCCHKVDKRIAELLRHKQRARVRQQLALEKKLGEDGVLRDKTGKVVAALALPTLPKLDYAENDEDMRIGTQLMGRRKSIARFARSLSRKVKKTPAPGGINAAATEAGVGLPPVQREFFSARLTFRQMDIDVLRICSFRLSSSSRLPAVSRSLRIKLRCAGPIRQVCIEWFFVSLSTELTGSCLRLQSSKSGCWSSRLRYFG